MRPPLTRPVHGWVRADRRGWVGAIAGAVGLFVVLGILAKAAVDPAGLEAGTAALAAPAPAALVDAAHVLAWLGGTAVTIPFGMVLVGLLWLRNQRADAFVVAGGLFGTLALVRIFKVFLNRARPADALLVEPDRFGFPSGHAATAAALGALALYLVVRSGASRRVVAPVAVLAVSWVILMAASRLVLRVHRLFDVAAGVSLGISCVLMAVLVVDILVGQPRSWPGWKHLHRR